MPVHRSTLSSNPHSTRPRVLHHAQARSIAEFRAATTRPSSLDEVIAGAGVQVTVSTPILQRNDRVVLYLGYFDLQGHQIEANTRRVLEHKVRRRIDWNRIAITEEQIAQRGLTPILKKDHRFTTEPGERGNSKHGSARPSARAPSNASSGMPWTACCPNRSATFWSVGAEQRARVAAVLDELDE